MNSNLMPHHEGAMYTFVPVLRVESVNSSTSHKAKKILQRINAREECSRVALAVSLISPQMDNKRTFGGGEDRRN